MRLDLKALCLLFIVLQLLLCISSKPSKLKQKKSGRHKIHNTKHNKHVSSAHLKKSHVGKNVVDSKRSDKAIHAVPLAKAQNQVAVEAKAEEAKTEAKPDVPLTGEDAGSVEGKGGDPPAMAPPPPEADQEVADNAQALTSDDAIGRGEARKKAAKAKKARSRSKVEQKASVRQKIHKKHGKISPLALLQKFANDNKIDTDSTLDHQSELSICRDGSKKCALVGRVELKRPPPVPLKIEGKPEIAPVEAKPEPQAAQPVNSAPAEEGKLEMAQGAQVPADTVAPGGAFLPPQSMAAGDRPTVVVNEGGAPYLSLSGTVEGGEADDMRGGADWMEGQTEGGDTTFKPPPPRLNGAGGPVPSTFTVKQKYGNGVFKTQHVSVNGCSRSTSSKRCTETTNSMKSVPPIAIGTAGQNDAYNHENALIQSVIKASALSDKQQYAQTKQKIAHPTKRFETVGRVKSEGEINGIQTSNEAIDGKTNPVSAEDDGHTQVSSLAQQSFTATGEGVPSNTEQALSQTNGIIQGSYGEGKLGMAEQEVGSDIGQQDQQVEHVQGSYGEGNVGIYDSHSETGERLFHPDGMSSYGDKEGNLEINVAETGHSTEQDFHEEGATRCSFGNCGMEDHTGGQLMSYDSTHDTAGLTSVAHNGIGTFNEIGHLQVSNFSSQLVSGIPDDFQFGKTWFEGMDTKMVTRGKGGKVNKPPFYGLDSNQWMPKNTENPYQFTINHGYVKDNKVLQTRHDATPYSNYIVDHHFLNIKSKKQGLKKAKKEKKGKSSKENKENLRNSSKEKSLQFTNSSAAAVNTSLNSTKEPKPKNFVQQDLNSTTEVSPANQTDRLNETVSGLNNNSIASPGLNKAVGNSSVSNLTANASATTGLYLPGSHVMLQSNLPQIEPLEEESGTKRTLKSTKHKDKHSKSHMVSSEDRKFIQNVMNLAYKSADEELKSEENAKAQSEQKKHAGNAKKTHREIAASKKQLQAARKKASNETLQSVVRLGEAIIDTADLRSRINRKNVTISSSPEDKFVQTVMTASKEFDDSLVSGQRLDVIPSSHFEPKHSENAVAKTKLEHAGEIGVVDVQAQSNAGVTSKVQFVKDAKDDEEENQEESGDGDISRLIKSENEDTLPFFKDEPSVFDRFQNFTGFQKFPKNSKSKDFKNFTTFNGAKKKKNEDDDGRKKEKDVKKLLSIPLVVLSRPKKKISFNNFSDFNGFAESKSKINKSEDLDTSISDDLMGENAAESEKNKQITMSSPVVNLKTVAKPIDWMNGLEQENDAFDSQLLQAEETSGAKAAVGASSHLGVRDEYSNGNQDFGLEAGWSAAKVVANSKAVDSSDSSKAHKTELLSSRSALEKPKQKSEIKNKGSSKLITKRNKIAKRHKTNETNDDAKTLESVGFENEDDDKTDGDENEKFKQSVAKASEAIDAKVLKKYKGGPTVNNHHAPHAKVISRPKTVALTGHKDFFETVYKASEDFDNDLMNQYQYHRADHHKRHHKQSGKVTESKMEAGTIQKAHSDYLDAIAKATKQFDSKILSQSMQRPPEMKNPCILNGKLSSGVSDDCRYGDSWVEGQTEGTKTWHKNGTRTKDPYITSNSAKANGSTPYAFTVNTNAGNGKVVKTEHNLTDCPTCGVHTVNAQLIDGATFHHVSNVGPIEPIINLPAPSVGHVTHVVSQEGPIIADAIHDNPQFTLQPAISRPVYSVSHKTYPVLAAQPVDTITCDCNQPVVHRPCVSLCAGNSVDIPEQGTSVQIDPILANEHHYIHPMVNVQKEIELEDDGVSRNDTAEFRGKDW